MQHTVSDTSRCDACKAECTSEAARQIVSAWKCSFGIPGLGLAVAFHSSDIGVDISHRYGAKRTEGRPAVPDTSYREMYHTMVQNNVDAPIAPRNSISCRRAHEESAIGSYHPPLNDRGEPIERSGHHIFCETDLDCMTRCGSAVALKQVYVLVTP